MPLSELYPLPSGGLLVGARPACLVAGFWPSSIHLETDPAAAAAAAVAFYSMQAVLCTPFALPVQGHQVPSWQGPIPETQAGGATCDRRAVSNRGCAVTGKRGWFGWDVGLCLGGNSRGPASHHVEAEQHGRRRATPRPSGG